MATGEHDNFIFLKKVEDGVGKSANQHSPYFPANPRIHFRHLRETHHRSVDRGQEASLKSWDTRRIPGHRVSNLDFTIRIEPD